MNDWIAGKIEHWSIDKLIPYARNARTHSPAQIDQIAASIAEFGFTNPILVGSDGVIVAGHGRLEAARKLGLETVPVIVLDHLTPTQRRALVIADNRIAENAGWDVEMLSLELAELQELDFNLELTGFSDEKFGLLSLEDRDEEQSESSAKEIDVDRYEMMHKCPRCGFEFNDSGKT
jgi:ParB-like chromosome segregation protein Spo0J